MADADWPAPDSVAPGAEPGPAAPDPAPDPVASDPAAPDPAAPDPGGPGAAFLERLAADPTAFGFFQAMRQLEAQYRDRPRLGRSVRPAQDAVRLAQEPSAIFAPSTLAAFEPAETAQLGDAAGANSPARPARLLVHFFGLFGPDGPLPLHLTDYARDRRRNARDPSFQRFADIFHHRALSLFWRAWADVRPTVSFDRPDQDRFSLYLGALTGLGMDSLRNRDAMPDLTKLHFAGRLANQTRHAEGLAKILSAFFTMPVRIETFVGSWLTMPPADRSRLGGAPETASLGRTVLLGARVWSRQHKFRIVFGPLTLAEYQRLLPGGTSFHRLLPIVRNYVGDTLVWDVNLVLRADEVPPVLLGRQGRLGWTSWLMPRRAAHDAGELHLDASADSVARRIDSQTQQRPHPPGEAAA